MYKLEKNQVRLSNSKHMQNKNDSCVNKPIDIKLFTCQPNEPIPIVELSVDTVIPAFSKYDHFTLLINLKSEIPEFLSINKPNQIKVKALLQQQNVKSIIDSSIKFKPKAKIT